METTLWSTESIAAADKLIKVQQFIGIFQWPPQPDDKHRLRRWLRRYHGYLLHAPLTFTYIALMAVELLIAPTFEVAAGVLPMLITELAMIMKLLSFWYYRAEAYDFMQEVASVAKYQPLCSAEAALWRRAQRSFARVKMLYMVGSCLGAGVAFLGALFVPTYEMPYPYFVPFNWRNPHYYWYAYTYELISMSLTCIANSSMDIMVCYYLFHMSLLFKLIGWRLETLGQLTEERDAVKQLGEVLVLHENVKRLMRVCERLISVPLLTQITVSAFVLCFGIYYIHGIRIRENPGQFFAMLEFLNVMILQIFLPCYYASQMTGNAERLLTCAYSSNWERHSVSTQKLIYIYMEFLKCPVKIRAGNFFEMGLPIFTKTMNNAYSLCAILLNMNE